MKQMIEKIKILFKNDKSIILSIIFMFFSIIYLILTFTSFGVYVDKIIDSDSSSVYVINYLMIERVPILAILLTLLNIGGIVFNTLYISKLILRNYKEFPFYISLIIFLLSAILFIFGISFTFYNSF